MGVVALALFCASSVAGAEAVCVEVALDSDDDGSFVVLSVGAAVIGPAKVLTNRHIAMRVDNLVDIFNQIDLIYLSFFTMTD